MVRCMQVSVDAARWPDDMLKHFTSDAGFPATPRQVRFELRRLKGEGYSVLPCGKHRCNDKGECTGEKETAGDQPPPT